MSIHKEHYSLSFFSVAHPHENKKHPSISPAKQTTKLSTTQVRSLQPKKADQDRANKKPLEKYKKVDTYDCITSI